MPALDHAIAYSVNQPEVVRYVAQRSGAFGGTATACIGVHRNGRVAGGVLYDNFSGTNIFMHMGGERPGWATRRLLWMAFDYPFNQLGLDRVSCMISANNRRALGIARKLGFKQEAVLKQAARDEGDLIILVLWRNDCRWHQN